MRGYRVQVLPYRKARRKPEGEPGEWSSRRLTLATFRHLLDAEVYFDILRRAHPDWIVEIVPPGMRGGVHLERE